MMIKGLFHQETITIVLYIFNSIDLNETNKQHLLLMEISITVELSSMIE